MIALFDRNHMINMMAECGQTAFVFSPFELCIMDRNGDNILTVTMAHAIDVSELLKKGRQP